MHAVCFANTALDLQPKESAQTIILNGKESEKEKLSLRRCAIIAGALACQQWQLGVAIILLWFLSDVAEAGREGNSVHGSPDHVQLSAR